ncbi:PREDICTED: BPI fold-containing family C protein-like, partial [Tinamus guttatus]|uniref:BPI fold-containing family C protein-like n=1 Tax=Tinamus guttatus TaxID=94827 RepID=UPI00052F29EA
LEANPGLKVQITQKGLDYGKTIGMELLKEAILKETFPSWSGQESFAFVKVNYRISRRGQGGITVSLSGLFMAVVFEVSRDSTGHLSVLLHNCQLIINSVKVRLNGGSSWVYNFLSGYLEKAIHTKLGKNLCLDIKYKIQMLDAYLRKLKVLSQIDAFAQIDYSLVSSPAVFKSHLNLDLKGDSMLYLGVSNYFLKSASLAYYRAGVFNITISRELATAFNLTTALFKKFLPQIARYYVAAHPVLLKLMATSPPEVSLQADGCSLQITGLVEVFAVLPNSAMQYIFTGHIAPVVPGALPCQVFRDKLGKGFPLPKLAHTILVRPVIKMNQGHLVISTDVHYKQKAGEDGDLHSRS